MSTPAAGAAPPPAGTPPMVVEIAGTLFLGFMLNWALFGVLSAQVYLYYLAFTKEPLSRKLLVYGVFLFEFVQVVMLTQTGFSMFAYGFGNPESLDTIGTIWITVPLMSSMVAFVVQAFYAYRISILSESKVAAFVILFLAFAGLAGGVATAIVGAIAKTFSKFIGHNMAITSGVWNGAGAGCDVVIALYMSYYLSRRNTGWKSTQDTVNRLIRLVIETGTLTAIIAIVNLVLSTLAGHPTYFQVSSAILGKLYSNSMMVMLNSRIKIGRLSDGENSMSEGSRTDNNRFGSVPRPVNVVRSNGGPVAGITVTRTQEDWSAYPLNPLSPSRGYNPDEKDIKRSELDL